MTELGGKFYSSALLVFFDRLLRREIIYKLYQIGNTGDKKTLQRREQGLKAGQGPAIEACKLGELDDDFASEFLHSFSGFFHPMCKILCIIIRKIIKRKEEERATRKGKEKWEKGREIATTIYGICKFLYSRLIISKENQT